MPGMSPVMDRSSPDVDEVELGQALFQLDRLDGRDGNVRDVELGSRGQAGALPAGQAVHVGQRSSCTPSGRPAGPPWGVRISAPCSRR